VKQMKATLLTLLPGVILAIALPLISCKTESTPVETKAPPKKYKGYFKYRAWQGGGQKEVRAMVAARVAGRPQVIPMSTYSIVASADGKTYSGTIVGTSPFASTLNGSTINVAVVPLKISIGSATLDASAPNSCDSNVSALTRFQQSPLVNNVTALTINGTNVGDVQFVNGLRRAEFWDTIRGSPAYQNVLNFSYLDTYELTSATIGTHGVVENSGCPTGPDNPGQLAVLSTDWLDSYLTGTVIPALTISGKISPLVAVMFLLKNTVQSETDPPTDQSCCILGYHYGTGTATVQTYGTIDWDTSGAFVTGGISDASIASHEIAEWMDDPLGSNATQAWGHIGQVSGCQSNWENGDPLSGTLMPGIMMNGKSYQMQELAFFSWFFNKAGVASVGAGKNFSSNGAFQVPAVACQ
jgi:hypothetical protein